MRYIALWLLLRQTDTTLGLCFASLAPVEGFESKCICVMKKMVGRLALGVLRKCASILAYSFHKESS